MRGLFQLRGASRLQGGSGPIIINKQSGFGYIAKGIGARQGEALIALRGTQFTHFYDVWTDCNVGVQKGPSGWPVHAGFNDTFNSFKAELHKFFVKHNPSRVHCVGHSLGGALATLVADYLSEIRAGKISLYTFGCPRVGNTGFAKQLTRKIKPENIYRVYHTADVVSMVPIFPFFHTPDPGRDIPLDWRWLPISLMAHKMKFYTRQMETHDSGWETLKGLPAPDSRAQDLRTWLDTSTGHGDFMFSARMLRMIGLALGWLIDRAMQATGTASKGVITVLDRLAWLLHEGILACRDLKADLVSLIKKIFQFLGRPWTGSIDPTVVLIRWALDLLMSTVRCFAYRSLAGVTFY